MNARVLVTDEILGEAAFGLFSSSSIERYILSAQRAAAQTHLQRRLREDEDLGPQLLERADAAWSAVCVASERDLHEVELAILLVVIAHTALRRSEELLRRIALAEHPAGAWVSALARRLLVQRSASPTLAAPERGTMVSLNDARRRDAQRVEFAWDYRPAAPRRIAS